MRKNLTFVWIMLRIIRLDSCKVWVHEASRKKAREAKKKRPEKDEVGESEAKQIIIVGGWSEMEGRKREKKMLNARWFLCHERRTLEFSAGVAIQLRVQSSARGWHLHTARRGTARVTELPPDTLNFSPLYIDSPCDSHCFLFHATWRTVVENTLCTHTFSSRQERLREDQDHDDGFFIPFCDISFFILQTPAAFHLHFTEHHRALYEYTMFNFLNLWGWWEKKNCWKNFEWCEKSWQLTWRRRSGALIFLHLRISFPVSHVLFSFSLFLILSPSTYFHLMSNFSYHPHSSDALFSPPSRLHAYWRVLSRLSSGGNYIIRVWAKWLSRVSIGGWTGREGWRLMERVVVRVERWTDVDVGQSKKRIKKRLSLKMEEKKGGSAQLINTQQLVRPQHDGWRWWRRKRKKEEEKSRNEMSLQMTWTFFSWFLEFDSFVFLVRVSSLRCGTVKAARWQRWWSSRRWWWLFFAFFLSFSHSIITLSGWCGCSVQRWRRRERWESDGEKSVFMTFREQQSIEVARRRKKRTNELLFRLSL